MLIAGGPAAPADGEGLGVGGAELAAGDGVAAGPAVGVYWLVAAGLSAGASRIAGWPAVAAIPAPAAMPASAAAISTRPGSSGVFRAGRALRGAGGRAGLRRMR